MKYTQPHHPSQRVLDAARRDERIALQENAYLTTALRLIAAPISFEVLSDSSWRKMGTLFGQRIQIAQRALNGQPLEAEQPSMAPDAEEQELARGHYEEQQKEGQPR